MYVQEVIKDLHRKKILAPFIKLDISKAFDLVNWPYLLHIMTHLGFGEIVYLHYGDKLHLHFW
jgi:hypothetical protein